VVHCSINLVPQDFLRPQVDDFIDENSIELCANDYNSNSSQGFAQTNAVHDLFQPQYQKPVFVVINGLSNSPSQSQWTLLLNQGGGVSDWTAALDRWRATIDGVQAAPPQLTDVRLSGGILQFSFPGQRGRTNRIEWTMDFMNWSVLTNVFGTNAPIVFRETNRQGSRRFYRVHRL
jgi:hypothetical protein